jgi:hypothetical protein
VGDVEDADGLADGVVFGHEAGVLDGHFPAGEGDQAGSEGEVVLVEGRALEIFGHGGAVLDAQLGFEFGDFGAEGGEFGFDALLPVGVDGRWGWRNNGGDGSEGGGWGVGVDGSTEKVGVGGDAAAIAGGKADDEGAFGVILQDVEFGLDAGEIREGVEAFGALAEFAGGLVTAKEEGAEESDRGG